MISPKYILLDQYSTRDVIKNGMVANIKEINVDKEGKLTILYAAFIKLSKIDLIALLDKYTISGYGARRHECLLTPI